MISARNIVKGGIVSLFVLGGASISSQGPTPPYSGSTLSYQDSAGNTVTVDVIQVFHWPCENIRSKYNLGRVLRESSEPSRTYKGGTSYVITYERGQCHYIRDKYGRIVHGPHVRL